MVQELIEKLNRSGNPEEQIEIADGILNVFPFYLNAYFTKGYALYKLGKVDDAIQTFEKSLDYDAHCIAIDNANYGMGMCYASKGELKKALKHFEISYNLDNVNENVILNMALIHEQLNHKAEAIAKYEEILKINPENNLADFKAKTLKSDADFKSIPEAVQKANTLYETGKYDEALKLDEKILQIQDDCVPAFNNQGLCYDKMGLTDKAIEAYENALKINPNARNALNCLGLIYVRLKDYKKANELLERNIEVYPENEMAYANNAFVLLQIGEYEKSIEMGRKALDINPDLPEVYNNMAWCYESQNDFKKAIECYDNALKINPMHPTSLNNKAWSLRKIKKFDEALKYYDMAIEADGEKAIFLKNIAATYKEIGDLNKAHEYYDRAFDLDSAIGTFDEL